MFIIEIFDSLINYTQRNKNPSECPQLGHLKHDEKSSNPKARV
jgi:hypothetical protein